MTAQKRMLDKGVKPSALRLEIYEYLDAHRTHPTVEEIYSDLVKIYPTLSKTTVYNTVKLLGETGIIKAISIEGFRTRYDANTAFHGHFLCKKCDHVKDVHLITCPDFPEEGYSVEDQDVYYFGVCKDCLNNNKNSI